jgi:peptidoglycan/LPS O-acetylase OafA/YrhL
MQEIKSLTAMRGIFALWVLIFHLGKWSPVPGWDDLPIVNRGYLAVDFFFVLSGYILGRRHGPEFSGSFGFRTYLNFIGKRFGRLFPLHWVVLGACLLILAVQGIHFRWWFFIVSEAALVQRWNVLPASSTLLNPPDWSISTEWAASLLFPVFATIGLRKPSLAALMVCFCGSAIVWVSWRHAWSMDIVFVNSWFPIVRCFAEFGIGISLARGGFPAWVSRDRMVLLLIAMLAVAVLARCDLAAIAVEVCLVAALSDNRGGCARTLSVRVLHWLGNVSYSIYLVQIPVLLLVRHAAMQSFHPLLIYGFGSVAAVLGVSWTSHKFVDRPGIRLSRRLFRIR